MLHIFSTDVGMEKWHLATRKHLWGIKRNSLKSWSKSYREKQILMLIQLEKNLDQLHIFSILTMGQTALSVRPKEVPVRTGTVASPHLLLTKMFTSPILIEARFRNIFNH